MSSLVDPCWPRGSWSRARRRAPRVGRPARPVQPEPGRPGGARRRDQRRLPGRLPAGPDRRGPRRTGWSRWTTAQRPPAEIAGAAGRAVRRAARRARRRRCSAPRWRCRAWSAPTGPLLRAPNLPEPDRRRRWPAAGRRAGPGRGCWSTTRPTSGRWAACAAVRQPDRISSTSPARSGSAPAWWWTASCSAGAAGFAGELGHVVVDRDGPDCGCGGQGCVEQYAGQDVLLRAAGQPDLAALEAAVAAGDPAALAAVAAGRQRARGGPGLAAERGGPAARWCSAACTPGCSRRSPRPGRPNWTGGCCPAVPAGCCGRRSASRRRCAGRPGRCWTGAARPGRAGVLESPADGWLTGSRPARVAGSSTPWRTPSVRVRPSPASWSRSATIARDSPSR